MRFQVAALLAACACAGSQTQPLSISPAGPINAAGPVVLQASQSVTWSISGSGSLSGTTGVEVTYQPVVPGNSATPQTATVTATAADGEHASVSISDSPAPAAAGAKIGHMTAAATVDYDAEQIPHVFCANIDDCLRVQGYLQAQDRLFEMDLFRRTARGQLAGMIGPAEVSSDQQFLALFITRDGKRIEDAMAAALDANTKEKLDAYIDGVNAYLAFLAANPAQMPGEYASLPGPFTPADIPQWTEQDTLAIARLQQFQLSETIEEETSYGLIAATFAPGAPHGPPLSNNPPPSQYTSYIRAQQPIRDYTLSPNDDAAPPLKPSAALQPHALDLGPWAHDLANINEQMQEMRATFGSKRLGAGSNNWVVDGAHSATGKAMVANDPHLALYYPPLFHLSAMTAADGSIDLAGGSFPGIPGALVGRGAHVGWGVTVVGYDVTDLYLEQVNPTCAAGQLAPGVQVPCVTFTPNLATTAPADVPTLPVQYSIAVRGGTAQSFTVLVVPHHGPFISYTPGATSGISMRWTGHEPTDDLLAFLGLDTASAVGTTTDAATATTAFGALRNYSVGAQNFVLADDQGNIGYDPHALVPLRPWVGQPDPVASVPRQPWLPLPGYGSAEWGPNDGTTNCAGTGANKPGASCWISDDKLPQAVNPAKGYLATANSDPGGYGDSNNPIALGPYLSFDWDDPTAVRYARIAELLEAKTKAGKVSVADMQTIQSDHAALIAALFIPFLPAKASVSSTAYGTAFDMLAAWQANGLDCPTGLTGTSPTSAASTDATVLANSAACLLFHEFLGTLLENVFTDDYAVVQATAGKNPGRDPAREIRTMLYMLSLADNAPGTEFCLNTTATPAIPVSPVTCKTQMSTALTTAMGTLTAKLGAPPAAWLWGKYHTLTATSPAAPLISSSFSEGPFARPGGAFTVDVGNPSDFATASPLDFHYSSGSNVRFIGTMDAPGSAQIKMQLPGDERDAPHGVFANDPDLLSRYVQNQYFDYFMSTQAQANATSTQGFAAP